MKKAIFLLLVSFAFIAELNAQTNMPYGAMTYQAIARDSSGNILANQNIGIHILITNGAAAYWGEDHNVTTNDHGLFSILIGTGTGGGGGVYPTYAEINWNDAPQQFTLHVMADFSGGTNYHLIAGGEIKSVPFSNLAREAVVLRDSAWVPVPNGSVVYTGDNYKVGIGTKTPETDLELVGAMRIGESSTPGAPTPNVALEISSTNGALLLPRLTTAERDALIPVPGMTIFNSECGIFQGYAGFENSAFANNHENSGSASTNDTPMGPGWANIHRVYQTFQVSKPTTLDSIRFWIASWSSYYAPAFIYDFIISAGTPDNPTVGTEVTFDDLSALGGQPPMASGPVTVDLTGPYALVPGQQYFFCISAEYANFAVLEASGTGAGTYANGQRWEHYYLAYGMPPAPPPDSGFNQYNDDLRFELLSGDATPEWVDLH